MSEIWMDTRQLDLSTRFDVFVKYEYARAFLSGQVTDYHRYAYQEHIRNFNNYLELGPDGRPEKVGPADFIEKFDELLLSVHKDGYDPTKPVPIDPQNRPHNGAHRIAACMALDVPISVSRSPDSLPYEWGFQFFRDRGLAPHCLDFGATGLVEWFDDVRIAVIYGAACRSSEAIRAQIDSQMGTVLYERKISLSERGKRNLIRVLYWGEPWLGKRESGYRGAIGKAAQCFPSRCPSAASIILFRPTCSADELVEAKAKIREPLSLGKHSLHITDTQEEAVRISQQTFNENGRHFLNNRRYRILPDFERHIAVFKETLRECPITPCDVLVVGSSCMSVYGIRDARDLDVIVAPKAIDEALANGIGSANAHWESYGFEPTELLFNPSKHFHYNGLKWVCLDELIQLKRARGEEKDEVDLLLIDLAVEQKSALANRIERIVLVLRLYSNRRWIKTYVVHWLRRLGLRRSRKAKTG